MRKNLAGRLRCLRARRREATLSLTTTTIATVQRPTEDDLRRDLLADLAGVLTLRLVEDYRDRMQAVGEVLHAVAPAAIRRALWLEAAIRRHRDQRGDDRCWMDDDNLYRALPEGFTATLRDSAVELENCRRFIESRRHPLTIYVSPQRRIEELEAENARLRCLLAAAATGQAVAVPAEELARLDDDGNPNGGEHHP